MKKLLTLSALLLFSVDVFADDEYCYASNDNVNGLDTQINEKCDEGDVIYAVINTPDNGIYAMNQLSIYHCDFKQEIIINSDNINTYLQCVKFDDKGRKSTPESFKE